jgi:murein DD-endopeptidase
MTGKFLDTLRKFKITSPFGERIHPVTKEKQFHNGIDLNMPKGTPIYAPDDATILKIWEDSIGGKQMQISTPRYIYGFAHLSEIFVREGQRVKEGDLIARTGDTGRVTGAHLHLTLRDKKFNLIDPKILLT